MLIVVLAYLYIIAIVALVSIADGHIASGLFTLFFLGLLPGFILVRIEIMKRRAARAKALALEQEAAPEPAATREPD